ncbi:MAG: sodium:calcium antiporter [Deltaproteobacteria bacterium]|nr:sodium:calcium antiporter [Deltaproteobacteria bacterium]
MNDYLSLALGVACAALGGELFLRGTIGIAHWARVSPGIIGATVAAFATSSPELSVSINAALAGTPEISLGDALGSNVVNVALILAVAIAISGMHTPRGTLTRDFPMALSVPPLTLVLLLDGVLSRTDGLLLIGVFLAWCVAVIVEARRQRSAAEKMLGELRHGRAAVLSSAGLLFLIAAGRLVVDGAKGIAVAFGLDAFTIGATVVAVGTSVPELATTIVAKLRGHDEVGLGTVLGSNIFNGLLIVGLAAVIQPITVAWREVAGVLSFGVIAVALTLPNRSGFIHRLRGALLLALYAVYLIALLRR